MIEGASVSHGHFSSICKDHKKYRVLDMAVIVVIILLIIHKILIIANSSLLNIAEHEIFSANKYENANYYCWHFHIY